MNKDSLAYYDTLFSGLVPCKVTGYDGVNMYITVTADRGVYKKGEKLCAPSHDIIPRKMVFVRNGQYRIRNNYQWVNGVNGTYAISK